MSALSILCLVLSFPFAFVFHDGEEAIVQRRWILAHEEKLSGLLPWFRPILKYLSRINTGAFIVAAVEELTVILASTAYSFVKGAYAMEIWSALFMAFSQHLLVHIAQAFVVRGYVPGLFTSFLLLPYAYYGVYSIYLAMSLTEMLMWSVAGVIFMATNLIFAHWLGILILGQDKNG